MSENMNFSCEVPVQTETVEINAKINVALRAERL